VPGGNVAGPQKLAASTHCVSGRRSVHWPVTAFVQHVTRCTQKITRFSYGTPNTWQHCSLLSPGGGSSNVVNGRNLRQHATHSCTPSHSVGGTYGPLHNSGLSYTSWQLPAPITAGQSHGGHGVGARAGRAQHGGAQSPCPGSAVGYQMGHHSPDTQQRCMICGHESPHSGHEYPVASKHPSSSVNPQSTPGNPGE
jgi:hypothetical protein